MKSNVDLAASGVVEGDFDSVLRMHDQMVSCLDFVIEKMIELHGPETELTALLESRKVVLDRRDEVKGSPERTGSPTPGAH